MSSDTPARKGKIVTFYSYKGGTGRSMALANVAWVLAASGKRVLTIDWDLEAPGLHRYFEPFLEDKTLEHSTGVIDFVRDFATAAIAGARTDDPSWYREYSNVLAHALPIQWEFPDGGLLHLVPAGRQDAAYSVRVNSFDWQEFYERLGGGVLLEAVKQEVSNLYDFVLIDSRTGVSDTSGVCTIQMPDELVVCFTLNRQSIYGASAAARSAFTQRHTTEGTPTLKIWPVPTRVESFEKDRRDVALNMARAAFTGLVHQLDPEAEDGYWGDIPVAYEPYYAHEEVLASFRDRPREKGSMLSRMEAIASLLHGGTLSRTQPMDEQRKADGLESFTTREAATFEQEFTWLAQEYESMRKRMQAGNDRTWLMNQFVVRIQGLAGQRGAARMAERIFSLNSDGARVVGLALARKEPQRQHIELALSGIRDSRSAFEQYQALQLARQLAPVLHPSAAAELATAVKSQMGHTITSADSSRMDIAVQLAKSAWGPGTTARAASDSSSRHVIEQDILDQCEPLIEHVPYVSHVRYEDDPGESHGPWVRTRATHALTLPRTIRIARYPVTDALFLRFVQGGGYEDDSLWNMSRMARSRFLTTRDESSSGPAEWPSSGRIPDGKERHPVSGVCYAEAQAFVRWCNKVTTRSGSWKWSLPLEDEWEFVARTEVALIYPWGDAFDAAKCNSSESGVGGTSEVTRFEAGESRIGCRDMAGNVWEFVDATDARANWRVLRGGSFLNNRYEVRSYLRLFGVSDNHRPPDFGFRLAQVEEHPES